MKDLMMALFGAVLAFMLSPGLLVRLPKNGSKVTVAACHAAVFGLLFFVLCHGMNTVAVQEGAGGKPRKAVYPTQPLGTSKEQTDVTKAGKNVNVTT